MSNNTIQGLKIWAFIIFSILGTWAFIAGGGTLTTFLVCYIISVLITRCANITYHRLLAHSYFFPGKIAKAFFLWTIVASALSPPIRYVIGHRLHHRFSDTEKDPHNTRLGFWRCFFGQFSESAAATQIPVKDILRQRDVVFVDKHYYKLYFLSLAILALISLEFALLSFLLINLRSWFNLTLFNYIAHGGKNATPKNLGTLSNWIGGYWGEQLHKNHHDNPSCPNFGKTSYGNFDVTYTVLSKIFKHRV